MALSWFKGTRAEGWAVPIPWWQDSNGKPNSWCGRRPSWHGMIFFVAAAGPTRALLNIVAPAGPLWYGVGYGVCLAVGLVIGHAIRVRADDELSRKCSATLGVTGVALTGIIVVTSTAHAPAATQPMAGYAPLAASAFLLLLTLGGTLLARLFPHRAVPCAQELETRIEELTGQLHRAHEQRSALGQGSAAEAHGHSPKAVRAWALRSGYSVPARGRIPVHILEAWRAAGGPTS